MRSPESIIPSEKYTILNINDFVMPDNLIDHIKLLKQGKYIVGVYHTQLEKLDKGMNSVYKIKPKYNFATVDADSHPLLKELFYPQFTFLYFIDGRCEMVVE